MTNDQPAPPDGSDPMAHVLASYRDPENADWGNAWAGIEPTFSCRKAVRKWAKYSASADQEDRYFEDAWMLRTEKAIARRIVEQYRASRANGQRCCMFRRVKREPDRDPWQTKRQNLHFHWQQEHLEDFEVKLSIDPEIFEYGIKPIPVAWFYDDRFVDFLQAFVWDVPLSMRLSATIAHGGGQFSFSAKTFLNGSLLADEIAYRLNHPELATWIMDWPNPDDRPFRATSQRCAAFRAILDQYWDGAFHPRATGVLTCENALLDRGFEPAAKRVAGVMHVTSGPLGNTREVFQTNFAFGRAVRLRAQSVHPGYWQGAHPDADGYRPDQIMRYGEANLNRLQIRGELHVKSGDVLQVDDVPELEAPLDPSMLSTEASFEDRAQMSRPSARDFVEALLLDVHHAMYLQSHPHVAVVVSLEQDRLLGDAERTLIRLNQQKQLGKLHREAVSANLAASRGRIKSDWIEPETLFWAAWWALPPGEKAAVAMEVVGAFVERVHNAATMDPRAGGQNPMEPHRHRIHPLLWTALEKQRTSMPARDPVRRELELWRAHREDHLARRPAFSYGDIAAPWDR